MTLQSCTEQVPAALQWFAPKGAGELRMLVSTISLGSRGLFHAEKTVEAIDAKPMRLMWRIYSLADVSAKWSGWSCGLRGLAEEWPALMDRHNLFSGIDTDRSPIPCPQSCPCPLKPCLSKSKVWQNHECLVCHVFSL